MENKPWKKGPRPIRANRLNAILDLLPAGPKTYLEIGVHDGKTLFAVEASSSIGVDPCPAFKKENLPRHVSFFECTSDEFFSQESIPFAFDLVFLDGLHEWQQTLRDLQNCLKLLRPGGIIIVDDVFPVDAASADPDPTVLQRARSSGMLDHGRWYGEIYKVVMAVNLMPDRFSFVTVGCEASSHAQMIVWRKFGTSQPCEIRLEDFGEIREAAYSSVFSSGHIPSFYNAKRETSSLYRSIVRSAVSGRSPKNLDKLTRADSI